MPFDPDAYLKCLHFLVLFSLFIEIPLIFIQECVFLWNFAFSSATNEDKGRRTVRLTKSEITLNSFAK